jgi:hypothetical protein
MRGWQRLGVVLSVIWFVGFGVWLWITSADNLSKDYQRGLETLLLNGFNETGAYSFR